MIRDSRKVATGTKNPKVKENFRCFAPVPLNMSSGRGPPLRLTPKTTAHFAPPAIAAHLDHILLDRLPDLLFIESGPVSFCACAAGTCRAARARCLACPRMKQRRLGGHEKVGCGR